MDQQRCQARQGEEQCPHRHRALLNRNLRQLGALLCLRRRGRIAGALVALLEGVEETEGGLDSQLLVEGGGKGRSIRGVLLDLFLGRGSDGDDFTIVAALAVRGLEGSGGRGGDRGGVTEMLPTASVSAAPAPSSAKMSPSSSPKKGVLTGVSSQMAGVSSQMEGDAGKGVSSVTAAGASVVCCWVVCCWVVRPVDIRGRLTSPSG